MTHTHSRVKENAIKGDACLYEPWHHVLPPPLAQLDTWPVRPALGCGMCIHVWVGFNDVVLLRLVGLCGTGSTVRQYSRAACMVRCKRPAMGAGWYVP